MALPGVKEGKYSSGVRPCTLREACCQVYLDGLPHPRLCGGHESLFTLCLFSLLRGKAAGGPDGPRSGAEPAAFRRPLQLVAEHWSGLSVLGGWLPIASTRDAECLETRHKLHLRRWGGV